MMSLALDFVLPSCPGIPESMWIAVSSMITMVTKRCWLLLDAFITIRLLVDAIFDISQGQFTLAPYGGTLLYAFFVASLLTLIAIFLTSTWTSKFMGSTVTAPFGSTLTLLLTRLGTSVGSRSGPGPNLLK